MNFYATAAESSLPYLPLLLLLWLVASLLNVSLSCSRCNSEVYLWEIESYLLPKFSSNAVDVELL